MPNTRSALHSFPAHVLGASLLLYGCAGASVADVTGESQQELAAAGAAPSPAVPTDGAAVPAPIDYNSFTINAAISPPSEEFAAKLAAITKLTLGDSKTITFRKQPNNTPLPPRFAHNVDTDVLDAVSAGAKVGGLDAAFVTGLHLNTTWGFLYTSAVPFGPTFDEYVGFLYAKTSAKGAPTGLELLQATLDKRGADVIVVPVVGNSEQGSGYFPKPLSDVHLERCRHPNRLDAQCGPGDRETVNVRGIGLAGLCSEHWRLRYVEPDLSVLNRACDTLAKTGRIERKNIDFITPVPGQGVFAAMVAGTIQGFEVATPLDDVSSLFSTPGVNPGTVGSRFIHYPGWHQQFLVSYMIINRQIWNGWSEAQHALIYAMARENMLSSYAETIQQQGQKLQEILSANRDDRDPNNDMVLSQWPDRDLRFLQDQTIEFLNEHERDPRSSRADRDDYREMLSALRHYVSSNSAYWKIREVDLTQRFDGWFDDRTGEPWQQFLQ